MSKPIALLLLAVVLCGAVTLAEKQDSNGQKCGGYCLSSSDCGGSCKHCNHQQVCQATPGPESCGGPCGHDGECHGYCGTCQSGICTHYERPVCGNICIPGDSSCRGTCSECMLLGNGAHRCENPKSSTPPPHQRPTPEPTPSRTGMCGKFCWENADCGSDCAYCTHAYVCAAKPGPGTCGGLCNATVRCEGLCGSCQSGICVHVDRPTCGEFCIPSNPNCRGTCSECMLLGNGLHRCENPNEPRPSGLPISPPAPSDCGASCSGNGDCTGDCNECHFIFGTGRQCRRPPFPK